MSYSDKPNADVIRKIMISKLPGFNGFCTFRCFHSRESVTVSVISCSISSCIVQKIFENPTHKTSNFVSFCYLTYTSDTFLVRRFLFFFLQCKYSLSREKIEIGKPMSFPVSPVVYFVSVDGE